MDFYLELDVFGAVPFRKKMKFLNNRRDSLYFPGLPFAFCFMRGHSLVELTEHDDSAADIILHCIRAIPGTYTSMHCCIHST